MISRDMNKFIHTIHKLEVIIYKKNKDYYIIDNDVYILKSLLNFSYCYKNNRKIIFITNNYINYILNQLKKCNISYVVIEINYGYDRVLKHKEINNRYNFYYKRGKE